MTESKSEVRPFPPRRRARRRTWGDRSFALLVLVLGVFLGQGLDFWRTFQYVASDVRAHTLGIELNEKKVGIQLAFVNKGNRQGAITEVRVSFPAYQASPSDISAIVSVLTKPFLASRSGVSLTRDGHPSFDITGVPAVLDPGEIHFVTIKGEVDTNSLYLHARPIDPKNSGPTTGDTRVIDLALEN